MLPLALLLLALLRQPPLVPVPAEDVPIPLPISLPIASATPAVSTLVQLQGPAPATLEHRMLSLSSSPLEPPTKRLLHTVPLLSLLQALQALQALLVWHQPPVLLVE